MRLIVRWLIVAAALVVAAWLTPGIRVEEPNGWLTVLIMAAVLGLANAFVRPLLTMLSCPLVLLTLGLFLLVINALTFLFAAWVANALGAGFYVDGFWSALIGSIIVSIVSFVLSLVLPDEQAA
jgi:putative membrane protein